MRLTRHEMLRHAAERDRRFDGVFITGVLTTGIYCLPSCPAKNPLPKNVRFFESEAEARDAGLRPCKRCRPDLFYRHIDPDEALAAEVASLVRSEPGSFPDLRALATRSGVGITKLTDLFRAHYHTTPAAFLGRYRAYDAMRRLLQGASTTDAALDAGFESPSAFHANMRRWTALTPGEVRRIPGTGQFTLHLPADYRTDLLLRQHSWDGAGPDMVRNGSSFRRAVDLPGGPVTIECAIGKREVACSILSEGAPGIDQIVGAHRAVMNLLGLPSDPHPFEKRLLADNGSHKLLGDRRGLRITRTVSPFEGLVWVIFGQAVSLAVAKTLRTRLIEKIGRPAPGGLTAHPDVVHVAGLQPAEIAALGTSRAKAEALAGLSQRIASGELPLAALDEEPAARIERLLGSMRGLGPWSINYLMMRSYGLADCVPVGDSGLGAALQKYYSLEARPKPKQTLELMAPFAPYRSLATFHLWMSLGDEP